MVTSAQVKDNALPQHNRQPAHPSRRTGEFGACRRIIEYAVTHVFAIPLTELSRASRGQAKVAFARQVAMYLAHVACGLSFTEIGKIFKRDRTTVAHACSLVEDRRDETCFDLVMELLECAVLNMLGRPPHATMTFAQPVSRASVSSRGDR